MDLKLKRIWDWNIKILVELFWVLDVEKFEKFYCLLFLRFGVKILVKMSKIQEKIEFVTSEFRIVIEFDNFKFDAFDPEPFLSAKVCKKVWNLKSFEQQKLLSFERKKLESFWYEN